MLVGCPSECTTLMSGGIEQCSLTKSFLRVLNTEVEQNG